MPDFEISALAEEDLIGIARYTVKQWDAEQASESGQVSHFNKMGLPPPMILLPHSDENQAVTNCFTSAAIWDARAWYATQ